MQDVAKVSTKKPATVKSKRPAQSSASSDSSSDGGVSDYSLRNGAAADEPRQSAGGLTPPVLAQEDSKPPLLPSVDPVPGQLLSAKSGVQGGSSQEKTPAVSGKDQFSGNDQGSGSDQDSEGSWAEEVLRKTAAFGTRSIAQPERTISDAQRKASDTPAPSLSRGASIQPPSETQRRLLHPPSKQSMHRGGSLQVPANQEPHLDQPEKSLSRGASVQAPVSQRKSLDALMPRLSRGSSVPAADGAPRKSAGAPAKLLSRGASVQASVAPRKSVDAPTQTVASGDLAPDALEIGVQETPRRSLDAPVEALGRADSTLSRGESASLDGQSSFLPITERLFSRKISRVGAEALEGARSLSPVEVDGGRAVAQETVTSPEQSLAEASLSDLLAAIHRRTSSGSFLFRLNYPGCV